MDVPSSESLSSIAILVHSPSRITEARSLQGDEAQSFINLIDRVSGPDSKRASCRGAEAPIMGQLLASLHLDQKLFGRCSRLLYKVCKARGMLPASYVAQPELIHVGELGWGAGGFADVSKGEYQGRPVAIKHLRIRTGDEFDKIFKVSGCIQPGTVQSLIFNPAAMSGGSYLETFISSERLAPLGSFRFDGPPILPHPF